MPTPISTRTDKLFPYTTLFQSTDKPLNLLRSSRLLAFGRLTIAARVGSTWEHAIFARNPSFSSATKERRKARSEEHTSELQSLMRISYAVFCLKKKKSPNYYTNSTN